MKILYIILFMSLFVSSAINAQNFTIPLWTESVPNNQVSDQKEETFIGDEKELIKNVQDPDIAVFLPAKAHATGEAVVICPGGGYWVLAYRWEGTDMARALNAKGIAAIVLKYRLPVSENNIIPYKSPLLDAKRAMRLTRFHAKEWQIDPKKIGIMGFSAGGHLASTLSTQFDHGNQQAKDSIEQISSRPDFSILIYPVITFTGQYAHIGAAKALLGEDASQEMLSSFSSQLQVAENTPPTFIVHSEDDTAVHVQNSLIYYKALQENDVSAEMHIYPYGGHGYSLAIGKGHLSSWMDRCTDWINYINE